MNRAVSKARWKEMSGQVKERWGRLTHNEIAVMNGEIDQLVGKIQEKYGVENAAVEKEVREWWDKHITRERAGKK